MGSEHSSDSDSESCESEFDSDRFENQFDSDTNENESDSESDENKSDSEDFENDSDPAGHKSESDSEGSATRLDEGLKTKIFRTLQQIKTPSAFAYSAVDLMLPNPVLCVPPHGTLGLPLSSEDAQKIISQAKQSPFGKGEETIVDTTFRKSWELNPSQFSLKNPGWNKAMEIVVDSVTTGLGLAKETAKVSAELHKLLLYEPGAFFKPHKDSEKAPGMFATLVVCLPSPHDGGKVVLTHDNENYEFETAGSASFSCSYAAWYSDITHEVLPVVSGYRLVLVYNLIRQTDFEIPSHDLVRGHAKQLSTLLEEYVSRLEEGDNELPPMLVHKLEHKYSKANFKINALKPRDLAQVQVLRQLSTKLGFDIYLASLELSVNKVDEFDDRDSGFRYKSLEHMVELDGTFVEKSLVYPDGVITDPKGQSEDVADEEEHEGPTGNEGSPATFWYRDTVVVLVPPSEKLNFIFKFESDGLAIEPLFCKLMQECSQDPALKPKLEQLCEQAVKQKPRDHYDHLWRKFPESFPPYYQQAAATALDLGRLDLFDEACKTTKDKIMLTNAKALGRWAANNGVATMTDRLMKGVRVASSVDEKAEFLKGVAEGFKAAVPQPSSAESENLNQWSNEAILTAVAELEPLTKDDAESLARLCKIIDWSLFESRTKPVLLKAVRMTKISFIDELMSFLEQKFDEKQRSFIELIIHSIWNEFSFEAKCCKSKYSRYSFMFWILSESEKEKNDDLKEDDILHIIETTITVLSSKCVETTVIPAMLTAIPTVSKECVEQLFIPLVEMILKNELAGLKLPTFDTVPPLAHRRLVQALLTKFLLENVGPEPQLPTDWSLSPCSCKCSDCAVVNTFLQDPHRESLEFPCEASQGYHLNQKFKGYHQSWDITSIPAIRPNFWRIVKNRHSYEMAKSDWEKSVRNATETLSKLRDDKKMDARLKAYLDPYYSIIMSANINKLPDLKSLVTTEQSSENNENAASVLNHPRNQTSLKRANNTSCTKDDHGKRTRS